MRSPSTVTAPCWTNRRDSDLLEAREVAASKACSARGPPISDSAMVSGTVQATLWVTALEIPLEMAQGMW